ncbi:hypothetical protein N8I71_11595 [Roseibacterium sp. SDUM158016]|uniref:hypothetical protein n=1 Tax=Roseicyclus sediminis TaxID=2980997 RepID=UPI0021CF3BE8|nr:hypothetical protein [Roseibacterium sp. SDUM158016]MCU4653481.1 hypothetical protein [Roseibacterium sp. SDUM158016]
MVGRSDPETPKRAGQQAPETAVKQPAKTGREARLKAALKANMAKRKAQARKRAETGGTGD